MSNFYQLLLISLAASPCLFAQTPEPKPIQADSGIGMADPALEGRTISSVDLRFRTGKTIDEARIRNLISMKAGMKYSAETNDTDTKALYDSGLVDDVIISAEPDGSANVKLIIEVATRPLLAGVGFRNTGAFSKKKLASETGLKIGQVLSDKDILKATNAIRKLYQEKGYPDTKVSHEFRAAARPGYADLIFTIGEGGRAQVRNISFNGNHAFADADLRKEMETQEKGWLSWLTKSGNIDNAILDQDLDKIVKFYRDHGYVNAKVTGMTRQVVDKDRVDLQINVTEGPRYKVRSVNFGKTTVYTPKELFRGLSLLGGDVYSGQKVSDDVTMIQKYYGAKGYADAQVRPDIRDVGGNQIDIVYTVEEGSPFRVGRINIEGNTKTQDRVIRRELPLNPEDPFNTVELKTATSRLKNLKYFKNVDITTSPSNRAGYRDINVDLEEDKTGSFNFGVGFSSVDSVVGFVGLTQSNFDLFNPWNFTGAGQRFGVELRAGNETQNFLINFVEPWFMGKKLALGVDLFAKNSYYYSDYYAQQNYGGTVSLRQPLTSRSYLRYAYTYEFIKLDDPDYAPPFFLDQLGDYIRSHAEVSYKFDSRDAVVNPRKGYSFEALMGLSGLGGDVKTWNARIGANKYWNLRWDTIFSINGAISTVNSLEGNDSDVPIFEREYLGGPYNMRGFSYRDVAPYLKGYGPGGSGDETMGGNSSMFLQFEYSIPVIEQVRFVMFYDIGVVNAKSWDFGTSNYCSDVGVGVRLNLPFGPLALDYAWPVESGNAIDDGGQFQFYMNYKL